MAVLALTREKIFAKEVESILRSSHSDQFLWMERVFSIPLTKGLESWPSFIELTERRNLFVHCDGVVSDQYINVCKNNKVVLGSDICVRKKLKELNLGNSQSTKSSFEPEVSMTTQDQKIRINNGNILDHF